MAGKDMAEERNELRLAKDMPHLKKLAVKAAVAASVGHDNVHNMHARALKTGMATQPFHHANTIDFGLVEAKEGVQLKDMPVFHSHDLASCGCPCGSKVELHPMNVNFLPESEESAMHVKPSATTMLAARILYLVLSRITCLRLSRTMYQPMWRCRGHVEGHERLADKAVQSPAQTTEYCSSALLIRRTVHQAPKQDLLSQKTRKTSTPHQKAHSNPH